MKRMSIDKATEEKMNNILDWIAKKCTSLGVENFDAIAFSELSGQSRFSNNSITTVNYLLTLESMVYMSKGKKRILGLITSTERESVEKVLERLYNSMMTGSPDSEYATRAIDAAIMAGAKRVAGSLQGDMQKVMLRTSNGVDASDVRTAYTLNVRAFVEKDASGHGIAVSTSIKSLDVESAGKQAGSNAKNALSPKQVEQGKYTLLIGRTVFANLVEAVGNSASAFSIESGLSFLPDKLGSEVAVQSFNLTDHGQVKGGVNSRSFDDEGLPTVTTSIIE